MAAVLRVKRKRTESIDPELFFLACKRLRHQNDEATASDDGVVIRPQFAGTVESSDEPLVQHMKEALRRDRLKKKFKIHEPEGVENARQMARDCTITHRYNIISQHRTINLSDIETEKDKDEMVEIDSERLSDQKTPETVCVFDIMKEEKETITLNAVPMVSEPITEPNSSYDYVYDIFYLNEEESANFTEGAVIDAWQEQYSDNQTDKFNKEFFYDVDEEDSNDEDFRANDYPDEEDFRPRRRVDDSDASSEEDDYDEDDIYDDGKDVDYDSDAFYQGMAKSLHISDGGDHDDDNENSDKDTSWICSP